MRFISVGYSAIWRLVEVTWRYKDDKYFSCTFPFFEKATNLFNVTWHHACSPIRVTFLHWYPLTSSKNI